MRLERRLKKVALSAPMSGEFEVRKKSTQTYPRNCPAGIHFLQLSFTVSRDDPSEYKRMLEYLRAHELETESRLGKHNESRARVYLWAYPSV